MSVKSTKKDFFRVGKDFDITSSLIAFTPDPWMSTFYSSSLSKTKSFNGQSFYQKTQAPPFGNRLKTTFCVNGAPISLLLFSKKSIISGGIARSYHYSQVHPLRPRIKALMRQVLGKRKIIYSPNSPEGVA